MTGAHSKAYYLFYYLSDAHLAAFIITIFVSNYHVLFIYALSSAVHQNKYSENNLYRFERFYKGKNIVDREDDENKLIALD